MVILFLCLKFFGYVRCQLTRQISSSFISSLCSILQNPIPQKPPTNFCSWNKYSTLHSYFWSLTVCWIFFIVFSHWPKRSYILRLQEILPCKLSFPFPSFVFWGIGHNVQFQSLPRFMWYWYCMLKCVHWFELCQYIFQQNLIDLLSSVMATNLAIKAQKMQRKVWNRVIPLLRKEKCFIMCRYEIEKNTFRVTFDWDRTIQPQI